ncbi:MAG TPA: CDP-alcohol phosphatidyltransferase family protein [Chloroflexota bacterium]|nr:CDP-alcohol phosphatidyltransferase family protein [Chloroflexota bacterium]
MFTSRIQAWGRHAAEIIVRPLAAWHISPNVLTVLGLLLNGVVAAVLATGSLLIAGLLLLFAGGFDMLDGALARVTKQFSTFGAFLDSVLDRYSEAVVGIGLAYYETVHHRVLLVMLIYGYLVGSFMISYARARAEGLGLECKVGLLPRPERIIILAVGLLFNAILLPVLVALVVLTNLTAIHRVVHIWRLSGQARPGDSEAG